MIKKLMGLVGLGAMLAFGASAQEAPTPTPVPEVAIEAAAPEVAAPSTAAATPAPAPTTVAAAENNTDVLAPWEMVVFCLVVVGVIGLGIWKAKEPAEEEGEKKEKGAADYFLAGRGLSWWLVGFSLIAANISTEQFVGMSGQAANWVGLSIAGYEWLAAITLVVVAFTFLPMLLKRGVFTIPQFLEERYDGTARSMMAIANLLILVGVPTAAVIFAGAKVIAVYFSMDITTGCIIIAVSATVYVFVGGLKACAWTDLIWGAALVLGGGVVAWFALDLMASTPAEVLVQTASSTSHATVESLANTTSAWERFTALNGGEAITATNGVGGKLSMIRPADDPIIPWAALCLGLWIPNFFYWGLNQYIMQRTLASKSLAEGQKGIVFAAALKLLIPFVVIVPGIIAYNLFNGDMKAEADVKNSKTIELVEKSGKTPLYLISADYMVTNYDSAIAMLNKNAAVATDEQKKELSKHVSAFEATLSLDMSQAASASKLEEIEKAHAIEVPASVPSAEKKQRVVASILALRAEAASNSIIDAKKKEKGFDDKHAITNKLNGYDYDSAFSLLLRKLLPGTGWAWFVLAALFGAVVSSLASMLNSASTLFTIDIYNKIRKEKSSQAELVAVGKVALLVCAAIALSLAVWFNHMFDSVFTYIQEFQGFLSPGALCVFLFGFFVPKCPRFFGWLGIVINIVLYGILLVANPEMAFLNRMAVCLVTIVLVGAILSWLNRNGETIELADKGIVKMESSKSAAVAGVFVVLATIALYVAFWG